MIALRYQPGEFLNALRPESALRNENMWIGLEEEPPPHRRLVVRQISGAIARRIVCDLRPGEVLGRGQKFGMIKLGSRTELILPDAAGACDRRRAWAAASPATVWHDRAETQDSLREVRSANPNRRPCPCDRSEPSPCFRRMLTLGNLVCGFFAIVVASRIVAVKDDRLADRPHHDRPHRRDVSGWLIFLAMVFDALDGYVARLSRTASDFGAQLDSLCDLVTFGVAPAFLLVKICPHFALFHHQAVWVIAASYAACAALRLARFNVETGDEDEHLHFSGLPSPAAAAAIAGFAIMFYTLLKEENPPPFAGQIDVVLADGAAVFRRGGGAVDGLADTVSARGQPDFSRPADVRPPGGGSFHAGGGDGDSRLFDPDYLLRVRVLRPGAALLAEGRPTAAAGRFVVLVAR